jgi:hypothetical protein
MELGFHVRRKPLTPAFHPGFPASIAIFMSDQRVDSIVYSGIPYATEQGIFSRNREI